jgi:hypothetical protein
MTETELLLVIEQMQNALMKVEWVKRQHGSATVCPFCGQVPIEDGGPDHAEDCEWSKLVGWKPDA